MTDSKKSVPMDVTAREGDGAMHVARPRNTYAMDRLIEEVTDLFPETSYEVSDRSPRGVAHTVQFTLTQGSMGLRDLLTLIEGDERVREVVADAEGVLVTFHPNPTIMDSRDPFDLDSAWEVMSEGGHVLHIPSELSFPGGFDAEHDGPSL